MDSERRTDELKLPQGVTIRTHESGRKAIQVAFTYKGKHCRETLKGRPVSKIHLRYAAELVMRIRNEIATGDFNYAKHFPNSPNARRIEGPASTLTVSELMDEFLEERETSWQPSTLRALKSMTETYIKPGIGKLLVSELSTTQIAAWLRSPSMSGLSLKFVRNLMSPLRLALFHAVHKGYTTENPAASSVLNVKLLVPKTHWRPGSVADPFSESEIGRILEACTEPAFRNFVQFAFATGLRTGELIGLKWSEVHVDRRVVYVRRAVVEGYEKGTKTPKGQRWVDLNDEALAALKDQALLSSEKPRVFFHPSTGLPFRNAAQVYFLWRQVLENTDVRFRCPRQTRHTFASTHITSGANLFWLAEQMGHRGIDMLSRHYGAFIRENAAMRPVPPPPRTPDFSTNSQEREILPGIHLR